MSEYIEYFDKQAREYMVQAADFIVAHGTANTTDGTWQTRYDDVPIDTCPRDALNRLFEPIARLLAYRTEVIGLETGPDGWTITYDPAYCLHCPETTPIKREDAIDPELQNKLEAVAAFIVKDGTDTTQSGHCNTPASMIPPDLLPPEMVAKHMEDIVGLLYTYDAVSDVDIDEDGNIDVSYFLNFCPNFYDPYEPEPDPNREILDPMEKRYFHDIQEMLAACNPAVVPEKEVQQHGGISDVGM